MEDVKVSIIVPIFNMQKYLPACIESIIGQTLKEIEIILVDDGSTDKSLEICKKYAMRDHRIKIITQDNSGVSAARNKGLEVASGEYIGFVDADDWIEREMYESMYGQAQRIKAEVILCDYVEQEEKQKNKQYHIENTVLISQQEKEEFIISLLAGNDLLGTGCRNLCRGVYVYLYKHSLIEKIGIKFDPQIAIGEDFLFNVQILFKANKIGVNQGKYYYYRTNEASATQKYRPDLELEHEVLMDKIEEILEKNTLKNKLEKQLVIMRLTYLIKNVVNESCRDNHKAYRFKIKKIKNMCGKPKMQEALKKYNTRDLPIQRRIWFMLYKTKSGTLLYTYYHYLIR